MLFLSEAFTPPARQYGLAKLGFTQSYSYFTWRTAKWELTEFGNDIARTRRLPPAEPVRQHPRHPARRPAAQRPGHVRHPRGAGGDHEPGLGRVLRLRAVRASRGAGGQRGIPRFGEVRIASPRLCGRARRGQITGAVHQAAQRDSPAASRTAAVAHDSFPPRRQRSVAGLQQVRPGHRRLRFGGGDAQRVRARGSDAVVRHGRIGYGAIRAVLGAR